MKRKRSKPPVILESSPVGKKGVYPVFDEASLKKEINTILRNVSGKVDSSDPLVCFLYSLMRDEVAAGEVEKLVRDAEMSYLKRPILYSNGWLAKYAIHLAGRLRKPK